MNYALIFAGGVGSRMGTKGTPKQFLEVYGKPIIIHTMEQFQQHENIDGIVCVCIATHLNYMERLVERFGITKVMRVVPGGATGQESIYNGLVAFQEFAMPDDVILINDGVRPVISEELISANIQSVEKYGNAISACPAIETVCIAGSQSNIQEVIPRQKCIIAKAPQSFRLKDIVYCHNKAKEEHFETAIDSADLMRRYGFDLHFVQCSPSNIKITTPVDYYLFKGILNAHESMQVIGI